MTLSIGDARRVHLLALVSLLAVVTPPRRRASDGGMSEHEVAPGMVVRSLLTPSGERAFRVIVQGELVLHLIAKTGGPPTGFSLDGEWRPLLEAVAAPWRIFCGEGVKPDIGPKRRFHAERSPYDARRPSTATQLSGPSLVRLIAECTASLGTAWPVDGPERRLPLDAPGTQARILRIGDELHVLVQRGPCLLLAATMSRFDLRRPGRTFHRVGGRWLSQALEAIRVAPDQVDPADLVRFCQGGEPGHA